MSRGVVIAAIGVVILLVALVLNSTLLDAPEPNGALDAAAPAAESPPPAAPAQDRAETRATPATGPAEPSEAGDRAEAAPTAAIAPADAPPAAAPAPPAENAEVAPGGDSQAGDTPLAPAFSVARIGPDGSAVLAGTAAPGAVVTVLVDGESVGEAEADRSGEWVLVPEMALVPGDRQIALTALNLDGSTARSAQIVAIALREDGERPLAVLADADAPGDAVILQQPESAEEPAPAQTASAPAETAGAEARPEPYVAIVGVDYDEQGAYVVSGRGTPGLSVRLYRDTAAVGETRVGDDGLWTVRPDETLRLGVYALRADLLAGDTVAARAEVSFLRELEAMQLTEDGRVIVQPGNSLWRIARRLYGDGAAFTIIYQANREQIRDPDLIYPNQIFLAPEREG